ncbi:MAG: PilZ domain-containing protein [Sphingomonas sp.]|nr:PilZ domain-containing protein [Sphingomonas sp.]
MASTIAQFIGVGARRMFSAEIVIKPKENRRSPRHAVDMPGRISTEGHWRSVCRIVDISRYGARLSTFSALTKNTVIWLNLPGMLARKSEIVWADDYNAACEFFVPMTAAEVSALTLRFGFDVEPERPLESIIIIG